jgi:outer membrane lipoprotein SlyB
MPITKSPIFKQNGPQDPVTQVQATTNYIAREVVAPSANPKVVHPQNPEPAVARAPDSATELCMDCGTVESVTPVEVQGTGSGTGAIAGGVLGAVVGHQVGDGTGKALATILGAVGGGVAGNAVEKKMKKVTHYDVGVRMEDGSHRIIRQTSPASVGSQVRLQGDTLQSR